METAKIKITVPKIIYFIFMGSVYSIHFFLWFGTFMAAELGILLPDPNYDMDQQLPLFVIGFIFQIMSSIYLLTIIAFTRQRRFLWFRLALVIVPLMQVFLYRTYLIDKYGLFGCGKGTFLGFIRDYVLGYELYEPIVFCL